MNGVFGWIAVIGVLFSGFAQAEAETVQGPARLIDGDGLEVSGEAVRLFGIDAPETGQLCLTDGQSYRCGQRAAEALEALIAGQKVICHGQERDPYGRLLAWCRAGQVDLNREMVRLGWAVAFRRYSELYLAEELAASKAAAGLWRGTFQRPTEFRAARWRAAEEASPRGCPIKGNISASGRIYHTPWSRYYARTRVNRARGERWFCSEADALAAGWRPPLR